MSRQIGNLKQYSAMGWNGFHVSIFQKIQVTGKRQVDFIHPDLIILKNQCKRFGIDAGNEVCVDGLSSNIRLIVKCEIQGVGLDMGSQIKNGFAEIACTFVKKMLGLNLHGNGQIIVYQPAVFDNYFFEVKGCRAVGRTRPGYRGL